MRHLHLVFLSLVLSLQLTGCASPQLASSSNGAPPTAVVSSVPQSPAQSSRAPATKTSSQPVSAQLPTLEQSAASEPMEENDMIGITLQVGEKDFSATLVNSDATQALVKYFPMTVQMADLNRQEKFYDLPAALPAVSTERPPTIYSGDIMCWSGNTLVLFYSTFQNSYGGYVRLGTVDDPVGLAAALGSGGTVEVIWKLAEVSGS